MEAPRSLTLRRGEPVAVQVFRTVIGEAARDQELAKNERRAKKLELEAKIKALQDATN